MYNIKTILRNVIIFAACLLPCTTVYAGTFNPSTGDTAGRYIWIVAAVAAVALIALIITAIVGRKKKK